MSGKSERESRREERLLQETDAAARGRRTRILRFAAGAAFLAIAVVLVLIVVQSSDSANGGDTELEDVAAVNQELAGIPEDEVLVLGDPKAPVTLIEYGDLQCPVCKAYSEDILPTVIENQVQTGKAKLAFRTFSIIGEQSEPAGIAAMAAGVQGRGWRFVDIFYRNQGEENSGYANDEFLTAVAKAAGVKDLAQWNRERKNLQLESEATRSQGEAKLLGFTGTPSFAIFGPGMKETEAIGTPGGAEELEEAIEDAN
jgi:protein-disulfide isomerase